MNSFFQDLRNQDTLAPLKEFYQPQNMEKNDAAILSTIAKGSISSIEATINTLVHLTNNLKIYKNCMINAVNLQAESADIATKYANEAPQQVNVLPGVVSSPQTYDLKAIRSDNERMIGIKDKIDKTQQQKDMYLRLSNEDVRMFLASWKRLNLTNAQFDEFMVTLNDNINGAY